MSDEPEVTENDDGGTDVSIPVPTAEAESQANVPGGPYPIEVQWSKIHNSWMVIEQTTGVIHAFEEHKDRARDRAQALADSLNVELIVKNKNGQIGKGSSSKSSYGNDPSPPKG